MLESNAAPLGRLVVAAVLFVAPAAAQVVLAGSDLFVTPAGGTSFEDFSGSPIPAGFFGPTSDPFTGTIVFQGTPLMGTGFAPGSPDTIVKRMMPAGLGIGCPSGAPPIPIEIVALNLVSVDPITVTFNGGASSDLYEVRLSVSSVAPQNQGQMQMNKSHVNGGMFTSTLPVIPRFTFTQCTPPNLVAVPFVVQDPGPLVVLASPPGGVHWTYTSMGLPIVDAPGGGSVDHDVNTATPPVGYPATSNFYPGVQDAGAGCGGPGAGPVKFMNSEMAMLAAHGVLPNNRPPGLPFGFGDGTGAPCPCGNIGQSSHGCNNSMATGGGVLYAEGEASVSSDTIVLRAEFMRTPSQALFIQGDAQLAGGFGVANGDGLLTVTTGLIRFNPPEVVQCGSASRGMPVGNPAISVQGLVLAGQTKHYTVYYRDATPGFCTPSTWNFTNGYSIPWGP